MVTETKTNISPISTVSSGPIVDHHGRTFTYLRIALTERCNLRCIYCMPEEGVDFASSERLLTPQEIHRIIGVAAQLGVNKIRFTGGEPLLRRDLGDIIASTHAIQGIDSIQITTNGVFLADQATRLRAAGLSGVNISLDTLVPKKFQEITRRGGLEDVLAGLDASLSAGFESVKLNVVTMRGFNVDELPDFVNFGWEKGITVRFIELMPFDAHQIWKTGQFYGAEHIREDLKKAFPHMIPDQGSSTAESVFRLPDSEGKFAIIPAYTRSICRNCNRIRLTADGQIRNCLYSTAEYDLIGLMRGGCDDEDIARQLRTALGQKLVDGWAAQQEDDPDESHHFRDSMTQIGG